MAIRTYKPTTPARRGMTTADTAELSHERPPKSLVVAKKSGSGRNNQGKITVRHRGGAGRRFYRMVDFKFNETEATVKALEFDPNRSAHIVLAQKADGGLVYLLAGSGMKVGRKVVSGVEAEVRPGNRLPLKSMPVGSQIYNIELVPGRGGQLARSAGAKAQLVAKEGDYAQVRLPSGEVRLVPQNSLATLGTVGNEAHQNIKYGSAGRRRRLGWRPTVRGKAMNPVDHRHGGGEGGTSIGLASPVTPWGKPALGYKTRKPQMSDKYIVRSRKAGRRGR